MMRIRISILSQCIEIYDDNDFFYRRYSISTAKNGAGEQRGSFRTPRGRHLIRAKIGAGQPENAVFVGRRPTGEIWTPELAAAHPGRDWILTRILWLSGREPGVNRLGDVDTMRRYIYLHGSPDTVEMGSPGSIGCVRMRNRDIIELFNLVPPYTPVDIVEFRVDGAQTDTGTPTASAYGPAGEPLGSGHLRVDGCIDGLAVLEPWRGKGVGTALLDRLQESAAERSMGQVWLDVPRARTEFFQRLGFRQQGEAFLDSGIPCLRMIRQLPSVS